MRALVPDARLAEQAGVSWRTMEESKKALGFRGRVRGKPGPGATYAWYPPPNRE
jgi:hypothetical protein